MTHPLVVHKHKASFDVYIGRPSKWGNPFSHKADTLAQYRVASREEAIAAYSKWLLAQPQLIQQAQHELRGKVLGCWCAPLACHGDVLAMIANAPTTYKPVTCIGARALPPAEYQRLRRCARMLESAGYTLRSGAADGSDTAFEAGLAHPDRAEILFVVCWTPGAQIVGGTGQALRLAQSLGIRIYNLADLGQSQALGQRLLAEIAERQAAHEHLIAAR